MYSLYILLLIIVVAQSATVVPLQSSHVDVRQSGAEFSYNIQENHGVATIGEQVPFVSPISHIIKAIDINGQLLEPHIKDKKEEHVQEQIVDDLKQNARANMDILESKKIEGIVTQPLLLSPYEYYSYYPYSLYSLPTLPKTSFIPHISAAPGIPYPYTLIRTA